MHNLAQVFSKHVSMKHDYHVLVPVLDMELEDSSINDTDLWQQNQTNLNWCSKCAEITNDESTFCTCTKDPFDAVDVFKEVPYLRVTLATYFICIVFGAVGNLITLFTMATADRKNKTGTNIFLISLSVS